LLEEWNEDPRNGKTLRYLANEKFNLEEYESAVQYAKDALCLLDRADRYTVACAYYYLWMSVFVLGHHNEAKEYALRCLTELPDYSDPYAFLLDMAFTERDWRAVLTYFEQWQLTISKNLLYPRYFDAYYDDLLLRTADAASYIGKTEIALQVLLTVYYRNVRRDEALERLQEYNIEPEHLAQLESSAD
jgi:tetratricopeptide (TPR) repeat protein